MKKLILLSALFLSANFVNAQNGLEGIVVEKYYVTDANDSIVNDQDATVGSLPVGSVTWRIYVDLLPGYKFQAVYGIINPIHEFRIWSTTPFYNNEDRGATTANGVVDSHMDENTVMLDSWFSVGAASSARSGIMKINDDGVATVSNSDGALQNNDPSAGIALTQEDGLITVTPNPVTLVGITNDVLVFDASNNLSDSVFSTINGSLACLTGSYGPDTVDNKVLIAQVTTSGRLCFKLNIQIGTLTPGGVENYVAENPVGIEILEPSLSWCSPAPVGINEVETSNSSFKLYSNLTKDIVTMEINPVKEVNKSSYAIYDMTGRMFAYKNLGKISGEQTESIDISSLANGQYFLELTLDGVASAKKIVKE